MRDPHPSRSRTIAWIIFTFSLLLVIIGLVIYAVTSSVDVGLRWGPRNFEIGFALGFGTMGLLIVARQPQNRIGWLYSILGLLTALQLFLENYAVLAVLAGYKSLPFGLLSAWIAS